MTDAQTDLRAARIAAGLSQPDLASIMGLGRRAQSTISDWETGRRTPREALRRWYLRCCEDARKRRRRRNRGKAAPVAAGCHNPMIGAPDLADCAASPQSGASCRKSNTLPRLEL